MVRPARAHTPLTVASLTIAALGMVAAGVQLGAGGSFGDPRRPSTALTRPAAQLIVPARPAMTVTATDASSSVVLAPRLRATDTTPVPAPGPQSVPAPGPSGGGPGGTSPTDPGGLLDPIVPPETPDPIAALINAAVSAVDDTVDSATDATDATAPADTGTAIEEPVESLVDSVFEL